MERNASENKTTGGPGPVEFAAVRVLYDHVMGFQELEGAEREAYLMVEKISVGEDYELDAEIVDSYIFGEFIAALDEEIQAP